MKGYKVFNPDWTCRGFQYEVGKEYEMEDDGIELCRRGFHFCERLVDCFDYYKFDPNNKIAEVDACGKILTHEGDTKCCTNKIRIIRELSWHEVLNMVNTGVGNTGYRNSGNYNSGHYNNGDYNSGSWNSGDWNIGSYNSGDWNSGYYNSGHYNSGHRNSGHRNSGHWNSGDWNKSDYNNGCFNTTKANIYMFNKLSDWTYKEWVSCWARGILDGMPCRLRWLSADEMTEEEKEHNKDYETTGGYLKELTNDEHKEAVNEWWRGLSEDEKQEVISLPNFDAGIFEEITGIEVD